MQEEQKFLVESLHRRKIILAVEAVMVNSSIAIGIYLVNKYVTAQRLQDFLVISGGLFGISYSVWVAVMNIKHHKRIQGIYKDG
ncbi:MAG: hypothetical protein H6772_02060 [Pseudomonadales bacterium]|nr:hypothetical protein [Pseudomonadales bacterium]